MSRITLPGLIDIHVHLRDPGQTYKEDFFTGTCAALAGGFTTILDMPNNKLLVTSVDRLKEKIKFAKQKAVCDIGFYFGSLGDNISEFRKIQKTVFGLKLYLNITTGKFIVGIQELKKIYENWPRNLSILVHAEEDVISKIIDIVQKTGKKTHICHVSTKKELQAVIKAKENGLPITCGVTPHHLFLSEKDVQNLGPFGLMKPEIERGYKEFLWKNLKYIDAIESDHAPHTIEEKKSNTLPFGVPGLETTLPLLLTSVQDKRLTIEQIIKLCYANPKKIFKIPTDRNTEVEIDLREKYTIQNKNLKTKCGWSPFHGWKVQGRVKKVILRGKTVFEKDKIKVKPGFGKIITPAI